jgi:arginyl-tRNA synthetase
MGALKYFILKVDPKKKMLFNPEESIDFNGNTGPFIQYTHARICSIERKADHLKKDYTFNFELEEKERDLIKNLESYPEVIKQAGDNFSPALIANYAYELAKEFNQFYHECPIIKEENTDKASFRLQLSVFTASVLKSSMSLLGINVPERM